MNPFKKKGNLKQKANFRVFLAFWSIIWILAGCSNFFVSSQNAETIKLQNAIKIHPKHEMGYVRLAQHFESRGYHSKTLNVLREGQAQIPESVILQRMEGGLYQGLGRFRQSLAFYTLQLEKHPKEELLYLDRAQLYWQIKEYPHALKDARKAIELNPNLFEGHYLVGMILGQTISPENPDQYDDALAALIRASELNERNPDVWFNIATLWEQQHKFTLARKALYRAVELSPESRRYLKKYVILLEKELDAGTHADVSEVTALMHKTLEHMTILFPVSSWVKAHYGHWAWTQEDNILAEKYFLQAIEKQSAYAWAHFRLAEVYIAQEKWGKSLEHFEKGLRNEPENQWALEQSVLVLEKLGKIEAAISRLQFLTNNNPQNQAIFEKLAEVYWQELRFDEGENTLLSALKLFPGNLQIVEKLLAYYEPRRLFEKAKLILLPLTISQPSNAEIMAKVGFYERNLEQPKQAKVHFQKALAISPKFSWARMQLLNIELQSEDDEKISILLNEFLKVEPKSEWALRELVQLKMKQNKLSEAEKLLKMGLLKQPDSLVLLQGQAQVFEFQKNWNAAEVNYKKLNQARPHQTILLASHAFSLWKTGQTKKAKTSAIQALYEHPGNLRAWYLHLLLLPDKEQKKWFGEHWQELKPIMESLANQNLKNTWPLIISARIDPFSRKVLKNLFYLLEGEVDKMEIEPKDLTSKELPPWIQDQWGNFHEVNGNEELAVKHYQAILDAKPNHSWSHARLGWVFEKLKKFKESQKHYRLFLATHPDAYDVNFRLANVETTLENEVETIKLYEKMINMRPEHGLALNNLSWIYLTAKDTDLRNITRAMNLAQKSVELGKTIDNMDTLAEAFFQSGETKKAIQILMEATQEVTYPVSRHAYLRKQLLRFRNQDTSASPPTL